MNCNKAEKFISRYIDGDLDEDEVKRLQEHIDKCEGCKSIYKDFLSLDYDIDKLYHSNSNINLKENIMKEIKNQRQPRRINIKKIGMPIAVSFAIFFCVPVQGKTVMGHIGEWLKDASIREKNINIKILNGEDVNYKYTDTYTHDNINEVIEIKDMSHIEQIEKKNGQVFKSDYTPKGYNYIESTFGSGNRGEVNLCESIYGSEENDGRISVEVINSEREIMSPNSYILQLHENETAKQIELSGEQGVIIKRENVEGVADYTLRLRVGGYPTEINIKYYGNKKSYSEKELIKIGEALIRKIKAIEVNKYIKTFLDNSNNINEEELKAIEEVSFLSSDQEEFFRGVKEKFNVDYELMNIPGGYEFKDGGYFSLSTNGRKDLVLNYAEGSTSLIINMESYGDSVGGHDFGYMPGEVINIDKIDGYEVMGYKDKIYKDGGVRRAISLGMKEYGVSICIENMGSSDKVLTKVELQNILRELMEKVYNNITKVEQDHSTVKGNYMKSMSEFIESASSRNNIKIPMYIPNTFNFDGARYEGKGYNLWLEDTQERNADMHIMLTSKYEISHLREKNIESIELLGYKGQMIELEEHTNSRSSIPRINTMRLEFEDIEKDLHLYIEARANGITDELKMEAIKIAESILQQYK